MLRTYQMGCTCKLMVMADDNGLLAKDWEQIDDHVGTMDLETAEGKIETIPMHLYEFTLIGDNSWFANLRGQLEAREVSCRHDYLITTRRVSFNTYVNVCSNCQKELATFDRRDRDKVRRIKFK